MTELTMVRPQPEEAVYVARSTCGRDRKRVFLAFPDPEKPGTHGTIPGVYLVNGSLHPVERPKKKHVKHILCVGMLSEAEREALELDYSNKTVAEICMKYDANGELSEKRQKSENNS